VHLAAVEHLTAERTASDRPVMVEHVHDVFTSFTPTTSYVADDIDLLTSQAHHMHTRWPKTLRLLNFD